MIVLSPQKCYNNNRKWSHRRTVGSGILVFVTATFAEGGYFFLTEMKADFKGHKHNAYYANDF